MPKRRRERDRPKNAPESSYDPSKRVLLSYGSDDEDVEAATQEVEKAAELAVDRGRLASHQAAHDRTDEEEGEVVLGALDTSAASAKLESQERTAPAQREQNERRRTRLAEVSVEDAPNTTVAQWETTGIRHARAAQVHTGQRQALGATPSENIEAHDDDDEYDTATENAMAYLDHVRMEREAIPEILVAARQVSDNQNHKGGEDDADVHWSADEDAYVGLPEPAIVSVEITTDPQFVFTKRLKDRFMLQRKHLHLATRSPKLEELGEGFPTSFEQDDSKSRALWHRVLSSKSPMPAQVRAMSQDTVFQLLDLVRESYLMKGRNIKSITSAWIWALLCRLDDVGNMNNDQVFPLRELGKRVVLLQLHFLDPEAAAQLEALEQHNYSPAQDLGGRADEDGESSITTRQTSATPSSQPTNNHQADLTENTLATLDMILVIVGEIFGQRDLLEFRQPWTKIEAEPVS